ncbi:small t antigen [bat polyomavirus 5b1]|uniref:Small t antigen n=1 Tax=bat polyomavirus 5b1 TaxID=2758139 RepID=A0A0D5ZYD6_9POLY|nr:small t antigen [bat polyomavirus 5b1]BAQ55565.1 small t antigen [bat polyomavirus 5b1]
MDKFMDREELRELCELLQIPPHCYGNLPMMKINYKKMSKIYHPDKGGDAEKMKRMNELWQKLQDGVCNARDEGPVSRWFWEYEAMTLHEFLGPDFQTRFCKSYPCCAFTAKEFCMCVCCLLNKQHKIYKVKKEKKCLVWGDCFCYRCYLLWFGFTHTEESFHWWAMILAETELKILNLFNPGAWAQQF